MGLFENQYPNTDFHTLNLDWILQKLKELEDNITPPDLSKLEKAVSANTEKNAQQDRSIDQAFATIAGVNDDLKLKIRQQYFLLVEKITEGDGLVREYVDQQIAEAFPAGILVVSPVTGLTVTIQQALNDLYDSQRYFGLTAAEYDSKMLTARAYDDKGLTAYLYDMQGATLLA